MRTQGESLGYTLRIGDIPCVDLAVPRSQEVSPPVNEKSWAGAYTTKCRAHRVAEDFLRPIPEIEYFEIPPPSRDTEEAPIGR